MKILVFFQSISVALEFVWLDRHIMIISRYNNV